MEVRPANACVTRQETGVDYTQHVPAKQHLEPSVAVSSLYIAACALEHFSIWCHG